MGVYVASKARHGPEWVRMREAGCPIISTWIDESGPGQTGDWPGLWSRCIAEACSADALVLVAAEGDELRGALVEAGAALAHSVPVFAVGISEHSFRNHPLVTECASVAEAFRLAAKIARPDQAP